MRKALNENPMVQLGVLGVVAVVFAFILFTSVLKKDDPAAPAATPIDPAAAAPAAATPSPSDSAAPTAVTPTDPATPTPADPSATTPPAVGAGAATDAVLPSKGLPKDLLVAFAKNKTIALLVIDPKGLSDKQMKAYTKKLVSRNDVAVFIVDVKDIAKYSRITAGVAVSRVPALVVIRPRKLTNSVPTASVSYGYRGPRSVDQAIDDALYKGKQVPAFP